MTKGRCMAGFTVLVLALALGCNATGPGQEPPPSPNVERGAQLYGAYCLSCHGGPTGGNMMDILPPHNANGHTWHHSDRELTEVTVQTGPRHSGASRNPSVHLNCVCIWTPAFAGETDGGSTSYLIKSEQLLTETALDGAGEMGEMMRQMMGTSKDVPRMPAFRNVIIEEDVAPILAYIKTWWTPEQREWQARVTELDR